MAFVDLRKLGAIQRAIAKQVREDASLNSGDVKLVAGFDLAFLGDKAICGAVVFDVREMKPVETKVSITKVPMQYIPGFLAFREADTSCRRKRMLFTRDSPCPS